MFSRTSFRVLTGIWVLCAMVLVNSYTGIVTSSLTTTRMKPSINTLEDLAASKEIGIVLRSDVSTGVHILVKPHTIRTQAIFYKYIKIVSTPLFT